MGKLAVLCDRVAVLGGAERYWETVIPGLVERHTEVTVLARVVEGSRRFGVEARAIGWGAEDQPASAAAAREVAEVLHRDPPDAVVTASVFDTAVLDAVRACPARWIARIHDHRAFCPTGDRVYPQLPGVCRAPMGNACRLAALVHGCVHGPRPSSLRRIAARERLREALRGADRVLVSSNYMRSVCVANGLEARRVEITPPPLPDEAYAPLPAERPTAPTVLFASRLTERKGLRSLVRALALLPSAERPRLTIAGEGEAERRAASAQAERSGIAPHWRGPLSAHELRAAIDEADIVAVPSLWPEPFGLIGIEAQARGRPAVAYDSGGIADWIGGAGKLVRRGDERALAEAIRCLLKAAEWNVCARHARAQAEGYRLSIHLDALLEIFFGRGAR